MALPQNLTQLLEYFKNLVKEYKQEVNHHVYNPSEYWKGFYDGKLSGFEECEGLLGSYIKKKIEQTSNVNTINKDKLLSLDGFSIEDLRHIEKSLELRLEQLKFEKTSIVALHHNLVNLKFRISKIIENSLM